jgi:hypothetical protein
MNQSGKGFKPTTYDSDPDYIDEDEDNRSKRKYKRKKPLK